MHSASHIGRGSLIKNLSKKFCKALCFCRLRVQATMISNPTYFFLQPTNQPVRSLTSRTKKLETRGNSFRITPPFILTKSPGESETKPVMEKEEGENWN